MHWLTRSLLALAGVCAVQYPLYHAYDIATTHVAASNAAAVHAHEARQTWRHHTTADIHACDECHDLSHERSTAALVCMGCNRTSYARECATDATERVRTMTRIRTAHDYVQHAHVLTKIGCGYDASAWCPFHSAMVYVLGVTPITFHPIACVACIASIAMWAWLAWRVYTWRTEAHADERAAAADWLNWQHNRPRQTSDRPNGASITSWHSTHPRATRTRA
jgi:hypothetical protein